MTSSQGLLARSFERLARAGTEVRFFLRDDDVDVVEDRLEMLLDTCSRNNAAINLAIIPGLLTHGAASFLKDRRSPHPELIELHQHGWMHLNPEIQGRKSEFGPSRSYAQQRGDIAAGKARMTEAFGSEWIPVFTPPWNRCTGDTRRMLEELAFSAISTDTFSESAGESELREIPITLDIFRWKGNTTLRPADEIVQQIILQMEEQSRVGILLHHKVMDSSAFAFLGRLLEEIGRYPLARFETFRTIAAAQEERPLMTARSSLDSWQTDTHH